MARSPPARPSQAGFTLLEVMVALIIAALALGVLYRGAIGGIGAARVASQYQDATARARSRLAAVGHGAAIVAGEQTGSDGGGFRFRTRIAVAAAQAKPPGGAGPEVKLVTLFRVAVAISWGEGDSARVVELDTMRVGFTAPAGP